MSNCEGRKVADNAKPSMEASTAGRQAQAAQAQAAQAAVQTTGQLGNVVPAPAPAADAVADAFSDLTPNQMAALATLVRLAPTPQALQVQLAQLVSGGAQLVPAGAAAPSSSQQGAAAVLGSTHNAESAGAGASTLDLPAGVATLTCECCLLSLFVLG